MYCSQSLSLKGEFIFLILSLIGNILLYTQVPTIKIIKSFLKLSVPQIDFNILIV